MAVFRSKVLSSLQKPILNDPWKSFLSRLEGCVTVIVNVQKHLVKKILLQSLVYLFIYLFAAIFAVFY